MISSSAVFIASLFIPTKYSIISPTMKYLTKQFPLNIFIRQYFIKKQNKIMSGRRWIKVSKIGEDNWRIRSIKIMTFNVLSQYQLMKHKHLYVKCEPEDLIWAQRWKLLSEAFKEHNADIICLQEVDEMFLESHYNEKLRKLGYSVIFKKRTGLFQDGCAIYYRNSMLNLIDSITVEYNQQEAEPLGYHNVGIVAKFCLKQNEATCFVIATTHLMFNKIRHDVRVAQMAILLAEIERISYLKMNPYGEGVYLPIIITGDFNASPKSILYQFIMEGKINYESLIKICMEHSTDHKGKALLPTALGITDNCKHIGLQLKRNMSSNLTLDQQLEFINIKNIEKNMTGNNEIDIDEAVLRKEFSTGKLEHPFHFGSSYEDFNYVASTYHGEWTLVDFIFFSKYSGLVLESYYKLPSKISLRTDNVHLPNKEFGSDHLPILANFLFKN